MADPALVISLAAEFVGKPAFKQADSATQKLSKGVKSLAKSIGVAFSVTAVLAYGKAAVKAAAADEKAQKQLGLALKNVGLGRDAASSEAYIQKLQSEFGIVDDKLRPAYQTLAVATRSSSEAQRLLNLALDISASTGKDLGSVTGALSKAFLGNNTALSKLGVGISKTDLKAKSFQEVTDELATTFAGSATAATNTFQGSMDKLGVASANVQEIIGKGLIDAFTLLAGDGGIGQAIIAMEDFGVTAANVLVGTASYVDKLLKVLSGGDAGPSGPKLGNLSSLLMPFFGQGGILDILGTEGAKIAAQGQSSATALAHLAELQANYTIKTLSAKKKLTAEELKALAAAKKTLDAKKLAAAVDKANLALGKGSGVFDMEKIQLAAAERNAAEQLGKITSQAQLLQITNDLARLEVKQSILALEDAIKTNDIAAITNATAKLNADLLVLGALTGQKVKLAEISTILEALVPKDLINLGNLDAAIARLRLIAAGFGGSAGAGAGSTDLGSGTKAGSLAVPTVMMPSIFAQGSRIDMAGNYNPFNAAMMGMTSGGSSGNKSVNVVVNAGTIAAPDELVVLIKTAIQDLNRAGDSTTFAGAIA